MFRFEDPKYLYLLLLILLWAMIYIFSLISRKKKLKRFGNIGLLANLMPDVSIKRQHLKVALALIAAAALIVSLARPQMGMTVDNTKKQGIEIIIALDISNSMLAEDIAPNRLESAKQLISSTVDRMDNDKVGIIVFAGDAYSQLPITSDNVSANMFLDAISPSMITQQGTDIAKAINLASKSFTQAEGVGRAIIVITDGENRLVQEILVREKEGVIEAEIYPDYEYAKKKHIKDIRAALQQIIDDYNQGAPAYKKVYSLKVRETEFEKNTSRKIKRY